ncbi:MAG TPA: polymorphic toxin-type HINT domain-containing protein [Gemmataceae bacterium]|jgi:hypothetical protein|nr:polymorphic toxin-type HINT domain-containing protein [Gemmataceae bacterium]
MNSLSVNESGSFSLFTYQEKATATLSESSSSYTADNDLSRPPGGYPVISAVGDPSGGLSAVRPGSNVPTGDSQSSSTLSFSFTQTGSYTFTNISTNGTFTLAERGTSNTGCYSLSSVLYNETGARDSYTLYQTGLDTVLANGTTTASGLLQAGFESGTYATTNRFGYNNLASYSYQETGNGTHTASEAGSYGAGSFSMPSALYNATGTTGNFNYQSTGTQAFSGTGTSVLKTSGGLTNATDGGFQSFGSSDNAVSTSMNSYSFQGGDTFTYASQGTAYGTVLNVAAPCAIGVRALNAAGAISSGMGVGENLVGAGMNIYNGDYGAAALDLGAAGLDMLGAYMGTKGALSSCFAAGTPLLTPTGDKQVEQFRAGDWILTAPEEDPQAALEAKQVEEVFSSFARIWYLHVGGKLIRSTAEHPFYVPGKAWTAAKNLEEGDLLRSHDGQWLPVESVRDSGESAPVYNLRIADYHTYFVGGRQWAFSVWAHNACNLNNNGARSKFGKYVIRVFGSVYKVGKADLNRVTQSSGLPTRLHQQVRKLRGLCGKNNVAGKVVQELGKTTTRLAKRAETAFLQSIFDKTGIIPPGNIRSFFPRMP